MRFADRIVSPNLRDTKGGILVEFALTLPILMLLVLMGVETARFAWANQKIDRAVATVADLTSQANSVSATDLSNFFSAAGHILDPFATGTNSRIIVTSISKAAGTPARVDWQQSGAGSKAATSAFGAAGANATLPAGMSVPDGQSIVVAEIFYDLDPLFVDAFTAQSLYRRALYRPRYQVAVTFTP